jgi:hypothetical protein
MRISRRNAHKLALLHWAGSGRVTLLIVKSNGVEFLIKIDSRTFDLGFLDGKSMLAYSPAETEPVARLKPM